jgi:hypothetical protein
MIPTPMVQLSIAPGEEIKRSSLLQKEDPARSNRTPMSMRATTNKRGSSSLKQKQEQGLYPNFSSFERRQTKISFAPAKTLERHHKPSGQYSDVTTEELWFTPYDFQRFNKTVQQEAKTVRLAEEDLLQGFDQSHAIAIHLAESVKKNAHDERLSRKVFNRLDMRHSGLAVWCCTSHDVRGLEKFASKQLRNSKHFVRKELRKVVLWDCVDDYDAETMHQNDPSRLVRSSNLSQRTTAERAKMLAQTSQGITRESRLFARMMGLADELAAKQAYAEDEDC